MTAGTPVLLCLLAAGRLMSVQELRESGIPGELRAGHPRLILLDGRLEEIRTQMAADPLAAACAAKVLREADALCRKPVPEYRKLGPRLLHVSRDVLQRMYTLGLAWRLSGAPCYAAKAGEDLLAVCAFPDWNPSHFLDTAEMSHAVGIGYDWFYAALPKEILDQVREGLVRLGLEPGVRASRGPKPAWWLSTEYNWNLVCNSGLLIGALAIAESDPSYAKVLVPSALASMPKALRLYEPDGAYPEGLGYWSYATAYAVFGIAALESALGSDFGLAQASGLAKAGFFPLHACGPTNLYFNFADNGERSARKELPVLFWLARKYGDGRLAEAEREMLRLHGGTPLDLIWFVPEGAVRDPALERDARFGGAVEVATFRSAWGDPDALFLAAKAGFNQVNHGNLDLGNFELDALGVRWFRDLGRDDYNLPGYWDKKPGGRRWDYYRMGSSSHNVPLLGGRNQEADARSRFLESDAGSVRIDLTEAYRSGSSRTIRTLSLLDERRKVLIEDEFDLVGEPEVSWGLTTDAEILADGGTAELRLQGRRLRVRALSPGGACFESRSAGQAPPQAANPGVRRLELVLGPRRGRLRIVVLVEPLRPDGR